jgi:hypothetical protein
MCQEVAHWVVGLNPFVESTMWGEGYNYAPLYSAFAGDIMGALPVGIPSHGAPDVPFWPSENNVDPQEVWVVPGGRWFWLMSNISGPAQLSGQVEPGSAEPVQLMELKSRQMTEIFPNSQTGAFYAMVAEGQYDVSSQGEHRTMTLLPGGTYSVNLVPGVSMDLRLSQTTDSSGAVTLKAEVSGSGTHTLALRTDNLNLEQPNKTVKMAAGTPQTVEWRAKVTESNRPWVAVAIPDNQFSQRKEATGLAFKPVKP